MSKQSIATPSSIPVLQAIGMRLKAARQAANYSSARDFALAHNLHPNSYSKHESGEMAMAVDKALLYTQLLNISIQWLLTGNGKPTADSKKNNHIQHFLNAIQLQNELHHKR